MTDKRAQEYAECLSWVLGFAKASGWEPECRALLEEMRQRFSAEASGEPPALPDAVRHACEALQHPRTWPAPVA